MDIYFSIILIIILSPILLLCIILLFYFNNGYVFFSQDRIGKNEKVFKVWKLKTMNDKKDINGNLLPDNLRITFIGNLLRKTSIDEFPQLFNVIKGNMSIVGPRPLLVEYLPLYNIEEKRRHEVLPGITGLAQVNGRNEISWKHKFFYDISYVERLSFILDIKILILTIYKVLKSEGIDNKENKNLEPFKGSQYESKNKSN